MIELSSSLVVELTLGLFSFDKLLVMLGYISVVSWRLICEAFLAQLLTNW